MQYNEPHPILNLNQSEKTDSLYIRSQDYRVPVSFTLYQILLKIN
jgi:hypothetical protein